MKFIYYILIVVVVALVMMHLEVIPTLAQRVERAVICHVPPGNPSNAHTIEVGAPAVPAHLAHGDTLGACEVRATSTPMSAPAPTATVTEVTTVERTPTLGGPHFTEASSVVIMAVSLPSTGLEAQEDSRRSLWPLLFVGILSSGMAIVVRMNR